MPNDEKKSDDKAPDAVQADTLKDDTVHGIDEPDSIDPSALRDKNKQDTSHARVKSRLQKRWLAPIESASRIMIREILAIQPAEWDTPSTIGEFKLTAAKITQETEAQVIQRMLTQIKAFAELAKAKHLKDNFLHHDHYYSPDALLKKAQADSKQDDGAYDPAAITTIINQLIEAKKVATMKPECKNNITRLTTNEFFFYPSEKRGPLSEAGFADLLSEIETLAGQLPDNLHLVMATFPVKNNRNEVHNIAVYIQCGLTPRIDVSTKWYPAIHDPVYPNTVNRFHTGHPTSEHTCRTLLELADQLEKNSKLAADKSFIKQVLDTYQNFPDHTPPQPFAKLIKKMLLAPQEELNSTHGTCSEIFQKRLTDSADQIILEGAKTRTQIEGNPSPAAHFAGGEHYHGIICCVTAGGALFKTSIEICLDHQYYTAKKSLHREMDPTHMYTRATHASQIVTSNYTPLLNKALIAKNHLVTHADTERPYVSKHMTPSLTPPEETKFNQPSAFCGKVNIKIYGPMPLQPLIDEYKISIDAHNTFVLEIEAYRLLRNNNPHEHIALSTLIDKKIYQEIRRQIALVPDDSLVSKIEIAKNRLLNMLDAAIADAALTLDAQIMLQSQFIALLAECHKNTNELGSGAKLIAQILHHGNQMLIQNKMEQLQMQADLAENQQAKVAIKEENTPPPATAQQRPRSR